MGRKGFRSDKQRKGFFSRLGKPRPIPPPLSVQIEARKKFLKINKEFDIVTEKLDKFDERRRTSIGLFLKKKQTPENKIKIQKLENREEKLLNEFKKERNRLESKGISTEITKTR